MVGKVHKLRNFCMIVCAFLIFVYLTLLGCANPSPELIFAIAVELLSFAGFLYFRLRRSQSEGGRAGEAVFSELENQYAALRHWSRFYTAAIAIFWLVAALAMTIDCLAFCSAFSLLGKYRLMSIEQCLFLPVLACILGPLWRSWPVLWSRPINISRPCRFMKKCWLCVSPPLAKCTKKLRQFFAILVISIHIKDNC